MSDNEKVTFHQLLRDCILGAEMDSFIHGVPIEVSSRIRVEQMIETLKVRGMIKDV